MGVILRMQGEEKALEKERDGEYSVESSIIPFLCLCGCSAFRDSRG